MTLATRLRTGGSFTPTFPTPDYYQRTELTIPTYEGSGQATHPDVLRIHWQGWAYWMAMTPLPDNDETFEDPSILVSNDGTTWQVPVGGSNPVVDHPGAGSSDTELVFWRGTLYLYWRTSGGGNPVRIWVVSSTDGVSWSSATQILSDASADLLSPAVVRGKDGTWRMWTINFAASPNTLRLSTAPHPLGPWTAPETLATTDPEGRDLWHLDVTRDGDVYRAFVQTCSLGNSGDHGRMLLGTSTDGESWSLSNAVLSPSASGFDNYSVYRSSGFYEAGRWRVWYGAQNTSAEWSIGYTEIPTSDFP